MLKITDKVIDSYITANHANVAKLFFSGVIKNIEKHKHKTEPFISILLLHCTSKWL